MAEDIIPLEAIAPDAREMIAVFRANGSVSFKDVPLAEARVNYVTTCRANGLAPVDLPVVRDHRVAVDGGHILVREYRPATEVVLPAVLFFHGGGWVVGNLETHDPLCRTLASESGAAVFAVDYRLAPEHPFPVPLNDCRAALDWLVAAAAALEIDPDRLAFAGDSAGGNLAAVLANTATIRPVAQVLLYPVTDLGAQAPSYQRVAAGFPLGKAGMEWFGAQYIPEGKDAADPEISPLRGPIAPVPLFIVTCGLDPLADEGITYAAEAARAGAPLEHHHLPRHTHGIFTSAGKIGTGAVMLGRIAAFLAEKLAGQAR